MRHKKNNEMNSSFRAISIARSFLNEWRDTTTMDIRGKANERLSKGSSLTCRRLGENALHKSNNGSRIRVDTPWTATDIETFHAWLSDLHSKGKVDEISS